MAAEEVILTGEDAAELRASHKTFVAAWNPIGAIESKLVWDTTIADWRLRRARRMEPIIGYFEIEGSTRGRCRVRSPAEVHAHPHEWFDSLEEYEITRNLSRGNRRHLRQRDHRQLHQQADGKRYQEFGHRYLLVE